MRIRRMARGMVLRVLHHEGQQLAEDLLVERVDLVVLAAHPPGQLGVAGHEGVEALLHHPLGLLGHARQVDVGLELRLLVQLERRAGRC